METAIASLVQRGDVVLVGVNGLWGERAAQLAKLYGADVRPIYAPLGHVFSLAQLSDAFAANKGATLLFLTHGESSTGTLQPVEGVGELCEEHGALFLLDTVCTLGGVPVELDAWKVDAAYSGSQKSLGAPPGMAPLSLSARARERIENRAFGMSTYYLDAVQIGDNWGVDGKPRQYLHTLPVTGIYGLREALAMLAEEGLPSAWARHADAARTLADGLELLGLTLFVKNPRHRLPTVTTVEVPKGELWSWSNVTAYISAKYNLEIAGGLGPTAGRVWRIGMMGHNARPANVELVLAAMRDALTYVGYLPRPAAHEEL